MNEETQIVGDPLCYPVDQEASRNLYNAKPAHVELKLDPNNATYLLSVELSDRQQTVCFPASYFEMDLDRFDDEGHPVFNCKLTFEADGYTLTDASRRQD